MAAQRQAGNFNVCPMLMWWCFSPFI